MNLYRIRNWNDLYENNRTRELKRLDWVPIPNKQDGDGYTLLMEQKNAAALYGAWIACVQIASRCHPRGTLVRDGGKPHDPHSLARMSRLPAGIFEQMFDVLASPDLNWLESMPYEDAAAGCDNPAPACDIPAPGCLEGKEEKGREAGAHAPPVREFSDKLNTARIQNAWGKWMNHRRGFKKPKNWAELFSEQVEWLEQFDEPTAFEILMKSVRNGYQGLFEPKDWKKQPEPQQQDFMKQRPGESRTDYEARILREVV